jgi:hypothetical protein
VCVIVLNLGRKLTIETKNSGCFLVNFNKVECPKTGHLRDFTREYFEYQLWNILGCRKIREEKDFYFVIVFCQKMKFI